MKYATIISRNINGPYSPRTFEKEVIELEVSKMFKMSSKSSKKNASATPISSASESSSQRKLAIEEIQRNLELLKINRIYDQLRAKRERRRNTTFERRLSYCDS